MLVYTVVGIGRAIEVQVSLKSDTPAVSFSSTLGSGSDAVDATTRIEVYHTQDYTSRTIHNQDSTRKHRKTL